VSRLPPLPPFDRDGRIDHDPHLGDPVLAHEPPHATLHADVFKRRDGRWAWGTCHRWPVLHTCEPAEMREEAGRGDADTRGDAELAALVWLRKRLCPCGEVTWGDPRYTRCPAGCSP
jgi:hypothetical protein